MAEHVLVVPEAALARLGASPAFVAARRLVRAAARLPWIGIPPRRRRSGVRFVRQATHSLRRLFVWRGRLFHYRRGSGGGETHLRALRSVGVGGHINPVDANARDPSAPA